MQISHRRAVIYLIIATIIWSTSGLFIKLSNWHPLGLNAARSLLAAGVVWLSAGRPKIVLTKPLLIGASAFALTTITFTVANRLTTTANAIFLQYSAPVWVAIFSIWLLKEYPNQREWLMMGLIFLGMGLFFQADLSSTGVWGNLISVLSGICLATMLISLRAQKDSGAAETLIMGNLIAFAVGVVWIPNNDINLREGAIIFYLGVVQLGLPFILLTLAIKALTAVETVMIQTLEPILSPIWVALIIAEFPTPIALVGALLVLTAVLLNVFQSEAGKSELTS
ncbi:MAG: DMT family transporter [Chloroflexota bacterium]